MSITLKAARVNKGFTQAEAAKHFEVTEDTLRRWEKGSSFPTVPQIQKIEQLYEVSYSDLIFLPSMSE